MSTLPPNIQGGAAFLHPEGRNWLADHLQSEHQWTATSDREAVIAHEVAHQVHSMAEAPRNPVTYTGLGSTPHDAIRVLMVHQGAQHLPMVFPLSYTPEEAKLRGWDPEIRRCPACGQGGICAWGRIKDGDRSQQPEEGDVFYAECERCRYRIRLEDPWALNEQFFGKLRYRNLGRTSAPGPVALSWPDRGPTIGHDETQTEGHSHTVGDQCQGGHEISTGGHPTS